MSLVTVDNPDIYSVSISQSPGLIAPAINVQIMPDLAKSEASWFQYEAPDLEITVGGVAYTCLPQETSIEIDPDNLGVAIGVQYYPEILVKLQHSGLKKNIVFLSCQDYEYDLLKDEYDEDDYEILHKSCDVYVSNGWTINDIITEIGGRSSVPVSVLIPPFHVPNPTVVFKRGQKFLPFIRSLLPGDFEYSWSIMNGVLTVSLIQSSFEDVEFIDGMFRMACSKSAVPAYDFVEIRGGFYKWGTQISVGTSLGSSSSYPNGKIVSESLPVETKETTDGTETYYVDRKYKTGPEGARFFSLIERTTRVDGPYLQTIDPEMIVTLTIRETIETFTYENDTPLIYLQPRQTSVDTETKLFYSKIATGEVSGVSPMQTYFLTDDSRVLSKDDYDAIDPGDQPTVILSAWHNYGVAENTSETFEWIGTDDADKNWFEGTQKDNTLSISHQFCKVDDYFYDQLLSPKELLQQVLTDLLTQNTGDPSVSSISIGNWRVAELHIKKLELLNEGSFQLEQTNSLFDTKSGSMTQQIVKQVINGKPPGSPSKYRTEQLAIFIESDDSGGFSGQGDQTCIPFTASIDTNNPDDFTLWAAMLWEQASTETRRISMASFDRLLPMGSIYGGVTMTSFQCSQLEDGSQAVVMGGV